MAFEEVTTTNQNERYSYRWSFIVTGLFLILVAVLFFFRHTIQTKFDAWRMANVEGQVVELPPLLIASPAATPTPSATPAPIYVAPVPVTGSPIPAAPLPHTGPDDVVTVGLAGMSLLGVSYSVGLKRAQAKLRRALSSQHVL